MKNIYFAVLLMLNLFSTITVFSQVGINQLTADKKLEITALSSSGDILTLNGVDVTGTENVGEQLWLRPNTPVTSSSATASGNVFKGTSVAKKNTAYYQFYADGITTGDTTYQGAESVPAIIFVSPQTEYQDFPLDTQGENTGSVSFHASANTVSPFVFSVQISDVPVATGEKDGRYRMANNVNFVIIQNYMFVQYELFIVDPDGNETNVSTYYANNGVNGRPDIKAVSKVVKGNNIIVDLCGAINLYKSGDYTFNLKYKLMPDAPSFMGGIIYGGNGFPTAALNTPLTWNPNFLIMASNNWVKYN